MNQNFSVKLHIKYLQAMLFFVADKKDNREHLKGVNLNFTQGRYESTNGYSILAIVDKNLMLTPEETGGLTHIIIPVHAINTAAKLVDPYIGDVTLTVENGVYKLGDVAFAPISGDYVPTDDTFKDYLPTHDFYNTEPEEPTQVVIGDVNGLSTNIEYINAWGKVQKTLRKKYQVFKPNYVGNNFVVAGFYVYNARRPDPCKIAYVVVKIMGIRI